MFECNDYINFEYFLHRHSFMKERKYTEIIFKDQKSDETYMFTQEDYEKVLKITRQNIAYYQGFTQEQRLEYMRMTLEHDKILLENNKMLYKLKHDPVFRPEDRPLPPSDDESDDQDDALVSDEPEDIPAPPPTEPPRSADDFARVNTRNKKIQQYDPVTLDLVKTFDGIMDTVRNIPTMSRRGILSAIENHNVYRGYRWWHLERDAPDVAQELPPTRNVASSVPEFVAMLDIQKTKIDEVFSSQVEAGKARMLKSNTAVNNAIRKGTQCSGHYFMLFDNCSEEMRNEYLSHASLPEEFAIKGTTVLQIDPETMDTVKTHASIAAALKAIHTSRVSLKKAEKDHTVLKGYLWRFIEEGE